MKKSISVSNLTLDLYLNHVRPAAIKAGILEDAVTEEGRPYHIADEAIAKEIEDDMRCACFNAGYDGVERTHEEYIAHEAEQMLYQIEVSVRYCKDEKVVEALNALRDAMAAALECAKVAQMVEASKTAQQMTVDALYTPTVCQRVTLCIDGDKWASEEQRRVYEAIKAGHPSILFDLLTRYAETHGIKWGGIQDCRAYHYDHHNGGGHYIVEGYISGDIGHEIDFCANCADILRKNAEEHELREAARG